VPEGSLAGLIEAGNRKAALEKIRAGADVNEGATRRHAPHQSGRLSSRLRTARALIAKKANLNVRNEFGSTPIAQAAELADAGW
jgi:hypothetical protein